MGGNFIGKREMTPGGEIGGLKNDSLVRVKRTGKTNTGCVDLIEGNSSILNGFINRNIQALHQLPGASITRFFLSTAEDIVVLINHYGVDFGSADIDPQSEAGRCAGHEQLLETGHLIQALKDYQRTSLSRREKILQGDRK